MQPKCTKPITKATSHMSQACHKPHEEPHLFFHQFNFLATRTENEDYMYVMNNQNQTINQSVFYFSSCQICAIARNLFAG